MRTRAVLWVFAGVFVLIVVAAMNWARGLGLPPVQQPQPGDLAINPEGTIIARSGGSLPDNTVMWYSTSEPKTAHTAPNGVVDIPHLIVRGETICVWSPYGQISVFDTRSPAKVAHIQARSFGSVRLSPSGHLVAYELEQPDKVVIKDWRTGKAVATLSHLVDSLCFVSEDVLAYSGYLGERGISMYNLTDATTKKATGKAYDLTPLFDSRGVFFSARIEGSDDHRDVFRWVWGREPEKLFSWDGPPNVLSTGIEGGIMLIERSQPFRPWRLEAVLVDPGGKQVRRFSFSSPVVRICPDRTANHVYGLSENGTVLLADPR